MKISDIVSEIKNLSLDEMESLAVHLQALHDIKKKEYHETREKQLLEIRNHLQILMRNNGFIVTVRNNKICLDDADENGLFSVELFDGMQW